MVLCPSESKGLLVCLSSSFSVFPFPESRMLFRLRQIGVVRGGLEKEESDNVEMSIGHPTCTISSMW